MVRRWSIDPYGLYQRTVHRPYSVRHIDLSHNTSDSSDRILWFFRFTYIQTFCYKMLAYPVTDKTIITHLGMVKSGCNARPTSPQICSPSENPIKCTRSGFKPEKYKIRKAAASLLPSWIYGTKNATIFFVGELSVVLNLIYGSCRTFSAFATTVV